MEKDYWLRQDISNRILELADEQEQMTRSDFQGRAEIVAQEIIQAVRKGAEKDGANGSTGAAIKVRCGYCDGIFMLDGKPGNYSSLHRCV